MALHFAKSSISVGISGAIWCLHFLGISFQELCTGLSSLRCGSQKLRPMWRGGWGVTTRPLDGGGEGLCRDSDGFAPEGCFGGITMFFMNESSAVSLLASKTLREGQEDAAAPHLPAERGRDCQCRCSQTKRRWKRLSPHASFVAWVM